VVLTVKGVNKRVYGWVLAARLSILVSLLAKMITN
jgi:hypothetical protein